MADRTPLRGMIGMRKVAKAMKDRKAGGGYSTWQFRLDVDESAYVRFRGLLYPVAERYSEDDLKEMDMDDLGAHAIDLQATYKEDMETDDLLKAILERYDAVEPVLYANHYVKRNTGKKGMRPVFNCGDSFAANMGTMREETECRACTSRLQGDDGVGWPRTTVAYSVWDYRYQHATVQRDGSKDYVPCTLDDEDYCKHCSFNDKQEDEKKHRKRYEQGLRVTEFSQTAGAQVESMAARVAKVCRDCGAGKVKTDGAYCPACEVEYDLDELHEAGWKANTPGIVACPACDVEAVPVEVCHCTKCDDGTRTRLCDVIVLVERIDSRTWSFTEQMPPQLLDPEEELDARILARELADLDDYSKPPSVTDQMKFCGLDEDPLGEVDPEEPRRGQRRRNGDDEGEEEEERPSRRKSGVRRKKKAGSPFRGKKGSSKKKSKGSGIRV